jgi:hypothetical protein
MRLPTRGRVTPSGADIDRRLVRGVRLVIVMAWLDPAITRGTVPER